MGIIKQAEWGKRPWTWDSPECKGQGLGCLRALSWNHRGGTHSWCVLGYVMALLESYFLNCIIERLLTRVLHCWGELNDTTWWGAGCCSLSHILKALNQKDPDSLLYSTVSSIFAAVTLATILLHPQKTFQDFKTSSNELILEPQMSGFFAAIHIEWDHWTQQWTADIKIFTFEQKWFQKANRDDLNHFSVPAGQWPQASWRVWLFLVCTFISHKALVFIFRGTHYWLSLIAKTQVHTSNFVWEFWFHLFISNFWTAFLCVCVYGQPYVRGFEIC